MIDLTVAPPLVDAGELDEFPGGPFDETSVAVAGAMVRGVCGWHIAPSMTVDLVLDSDGGRVLLLPSLHLTSVLAVTDRSGRPIEGWAHSAAGMLDHPGGWPRGFGAVTAKVVHGLPTTPTDLVAVVADLARARAAAATRPVGLRRKTVGEVTYDYVDPTSRAAAHDPTTDYGHVLDRYRL